MRFGFRGRLIGGFGVLLIFLSLVTVVGIKGMSDLRALTNQMTSSDVPGLYYANATVGDLHQARESVLSFVLAEDDASRTQELVELQQARASFEMDFGELSKLADGDQEIRLVQQVGASWSEQDQLASAIVDSAASGRMTTTEPLLLQLHEVTHRTSDLLNE